MEESVKIFFSLLGIFIVIGSVIQTMNFFPNFLNKEFDRFAGYATICFILIILSFAFLMYFLRLRAREGFEDIAEEPEKMIEQWKNFTKKIKLEELCSLYLEIQKMMIANEKGAPPDELTDEQAKEKVDDIFKAESGAGIFSCSKFQALEEANDIDTFYVKVGEVPDNFLQSALGTAKACRKLVRRVLIDIEKSLGKEGIDDKSYPMIPPNCVPEAVISGKCKETFVDQSVGICSPDVVEERRKFLREKKLSEQAQSCLLPEEVPLESKIPFIKKKLRRIMDDVDMEQLNQIPAIIKQATEWKTKLDSYKKEAEEGILAPSSVPKEGENEPFIE